jgi:uncharacterized protein (UPF0276 family)
MFVWHGVQAISWKAFPSISPGPRAAGFFQQSLSQPYTGTNLACVVDHIDEVRTVLGRRLLLGNPATYLHVENRR